MAQGKVSKRELNLLVITGGFLVFYLFYQFLLTPMLDEIGQFSGKLDKARLELSVAERKIKVLETLEKKYKEGAGGGPLSPDDAANKKTREEKALEVLRAISKATSKSRLNLTLVKPVESGGEGFRFELTASGSYKQLYEFLEILRALKILVLVDSLKVTGGGVRNPQLGISMSLTAYH